MWTSNMWHLLGLKSWFQPDVPVPVLSKTVSGHRYFWTVLYQLLTPGHGTTFQMCLGLDSLPFQNVKIHLLLQLLRCRITCLFRAIAKLWPTFWLQLTINSKLQLRMNCSLKDSKLSVSWDMPQCSPSLHPSVYTYLLFSSWWFHEHFKVHHGGIPMEMNYWASAYISMFKFLPLQSLQKSVLPTEITFIQKSNTPGGLFSFLI